MLRLRYVLPILVLVLAAAGCGRAAAPTKGDVIVFAAAPLSGFQANGGQTVVGGVRLAAEEINRAGGLLGYRINVIPLDDESDSDVAVEVAQQVAERIQAGDRVLAVIGHYNSGQTEAALEVYAQLPLVVITPTASQVSLTQQGYTNFFRINANDAVQAEVDARFLVENLGATRVAVLHNDEPYGIDLAEAVASELEELGAEVALQRQIPIGPPNPAPDATTGAPVYYPDEVAAIRESGADAIFYAGYEIECPYLRYDLREIGLGDLPFLASDGCFLSATIDESDGAAEGMYVSAFAPSPKAIGNESWIRAYQAVEYRNPDTYSVNGYVAMQVLAEAVRQAGSLDADAVAEAMHEITVETLLGTINYLPNGDVADPSIFIYQVINGEFEQVYP